MSHQRWFDVLDEEGIWRVGQCLYQNEKGMKNIALDGFHSNYTALYCEHSDKILPIRSKTRGLTVPDKKKPLRQALSSLQLQNVEKYISGRLNLYLLKPNLLQFEPKLIRSSIRTEFLVIVHKIVSSPFQIIRDIKMLDLQINKFFINLLNLYMRILDFSKAFMTLLNSETTNQTAQELYKSVYQQTIMVTLILGLHPHSSTLYDHKLNINLKPTGLIDYMTMSQGTNPFRNFIKNSTIYIKGMKNKQPSLFDMEVSIGLCEKSKNQLLQGQNKARTSMTVDDIISHLKCLAEGNQQIMKSLNKNLSLVSKIQSLFFKIKPNKQCNLKKYLTPKEQQAIVPSIKAEKQEVIENNFSSREQFKKMEERIHKLEQLLAAQQTKPLTQHKDVEKLPQSLYAKQNSPYQNFPIENLGEEMFLSSVEWALECGDNETAKSLIKWRKSILQVGRIAGWDTALLVACKTFKKAEISVESIIEANYQILLKNSMK